MIQSRWCLMLAVASSVALAACDRRTEEAVKDAGAELKREAAEVKQSLDKVGETTGQVIEDAAITAKVKAALLAEKDLKSRDINVETFQGKVVLKGPVPDQSQAALAAKIARGVEGVKAVENRLTINVAG